MTMVPNGAPASLVQWVEEAARHTQPDKIHWCDGSAEENAALVAGLEQTGDLLPLNGDTFPGCHLACADARFM